ncbi:hypothetical protein SODALDRAFT_311822 [Sodiomyces alkalinus F11]|uniref:Uncharacterized protein n=1 Tax=Sodiomyces alkalinus (strain CBS 110278 / VKM F-3762 / F11) TaxID=1314773 RepID=A0A3N2PW98_SODAK|nr:hypothetical protein SODALDRAFT_311822 [Sodiomyces alkalinus F11]ROT38799.1 hypothetical protein SODALDRAFT_311822 [Sodiomyces alkalinus F11]
MEHRSMAEDREPRSLSSTSPDTGPGLATGRYAGTGTTPFSPPAGHSIRRSMTLDEGPRFRRHGPSHPDSFDAPRRRSTTSLDEARELFNPQPNGGRLPEEEGSNWASVPLAFALLPALGGIFFQNGSAVVTDVMLLGLAAIFLHWSVTQPWRWYHSAQEVRVREEGHYDFAVDYESEEADHVSVSETGQPSSSSGKAKAVPGKASSLREEEPVPPPPKRNTEREAARRDALAELYIHEVSALASCFLLPALGAYLLHTIRAQLSRPSEGLVSNYNLTIFLLASELRPLSHLMRLVQSRTVHLQRIVHENPYEQEPSGGGPRQINEVLERLEVLESRRDPNPPAPTDRGASELARAKQEAAMVRDIRNAIQPELDALNRAVRRYEKKATVQALQTESRFGVVDTRLNDAIALAAAAAKNSAAAPGFLQWLVESAVGLVVLPFRALVSLVMFPFRTLVGFVSRKNRTSGKSSRSGRASKSLNDSRWLRGDRQLSGRAAR